eukprot:snap_masked-scaffold_11-processed-gene-3.10-mRNA-1 protein AED:1.00 eAED:1.00 QI:0/-1/0/0/-1/1/1/0/587
MFSQGLTQQLAKQRTCVFCGSTELSANPITGEETCSECGAINNVSSSQNLDAFELGGVNVKQKVGARTSYAKSTRKRKSLLEQVSEKAGIINKTEKNLKTITIGRRYKTDKLHPTEGELKQMIDFLFEKTITSLVEIFPVIDKETGLKFCRDLWETYFQTLAAKKLTIREAYSLSHKEYKETYGFIPRPLPSILVIFCFLYTQNKNIFKFGEIVTCWDIIELTRAGVLPLIRWRSFVPDSIQNTFLISTTKSLMAVIYEDITYAHVLKEYYSLQEFLELKVPTGEIRKGFSLSEATLLGFRVLNAFFNNKYFCCLAETLSTVYYYFVFTLVIFNKKILLDLQNIFPLISFSFFLCDVDWLSKLKIETNVNNLDDLLSLLTFGPDSINLMFYNRILFWDKSTSLMVQNKGLAKAFEDHLSFIKKTFLVDFDESKGLAGVLMRHGNSTSWVNNKFKIVENDTLKISSKIKKNIQNLSYDIVCDSYASSIVGKSKVLNLFGKSNTTVEFAEQYLFLVNLLGRVGNLNPNSFKILLPVKKEYRTQTLFNLTNKIISNTKIISSLMNFGLSGSNEETAETRKESNFEKKKND